MNAHVAGMEHERHRCQQIDVLLERDAALRVVAPHHHTHRHCNPIACILRRCQRSVGNLGAKHNSGRVQQQILDQHARFAATSANPSGTAYPSACSVACPDCSSCSATSTLGAVNDGMYLPTGSFSASSPSSTHAITPAATSACVASKSLNFTITERQPWSWMRCG